MKGKSCWMSLVLVAALAAACARPTPEPAFLMEPCPNLPPPEIPQPTNERANKRALLPNPRDPGRPMGWWDPPQPDPPQPAQSLAVLQDAQVLEKLPFIPADTPVEIGDWIVRVGNLRWTYEYFDPYIGKPVRSECPWLSYEWEFRRIRDEETKAFINPLIPLFGSVTKPAWLVTGLYLGIGDYRGGYPIEYERWDPNPEREGEEGEGYRCRCLTHVRPEWDPRWLVIRAVREGAGLMIVPVPVTEDHPIARVEVPPPPPVPKR